LREAGDARCGAEGGQMNEGNKVEIHTIHKAMTEESKEDMER